MRTLFLTTAAFAALVMVAPVGKAHAAGAGEWWNFDTEAKRCVSDITPRDQIALYKVHDVNDDTLSYVKNERGELMYAQIRASDDGDFLVFSTFYHSYHKNGKLVTAKKSCEEVEASLATARNAGK